MEDSVRNQASGGRSAAPHSQARWIVTVFLVTILISGLFSLLSSLIFETCALLVAFLVLLLIVAVGIVFDMVGVAVTAADETPVRPRLLQAALPGSECTPHPQGKHGKRHPRGRNGLAGHPRSARRAELHLRKLAVTQKNPLMQSKALHQGYFFRRAVTPSG